MGAGSLTILYSNENTLFCLNPQITYFKSVFRKHTKFVMTDFHHTSAANNKRNFSDGAGDVTFDFLAAGDLLAKVSLQIDVDEDADKTWTKFPNNIGTALLKNIIFKYNSLEIDSISPEYINFTSMLNNPKPFNSTCDIVGTSAPHELVCNNGNNSNKSLLTRKQLNCKKEVIISAGAIESPRILLASGIGSENELKELGITCKHNLAGVGENLQEGMGSCLPRV